jgi:hypothetical protein
MSILRKSDARAGGQAVDMARGTIHAVDENLFLVEGVWPTWPLVALPGPAVLRSGRRLYLLDTGAGPLARAAVRAITASFARSAEATLINSGSHPGLVGNNDLLDCLDADVRRHVGPPPSCGADTWMRPMSAAYPRVRPTALPCHDLGVFGPAGPVWIGGASWTGWRVETGLVVLEATAGCDRLAFYLPAQRALLLPDELALAPARPGSDVADVLRIGTFVLTMIDNGAVDVLSLGFGPPLDAASAADAVDDLMNRARTSRAMDPRLER